MMQYSVVIEGEVNLINHLEGEVDLTSVNDGESGVVYEVSAETHDTYSGPYEWTPTAESQIVPIADMIASQDIVINPIPSNYGLITWNGSFLTVS